MVENNVRQERWFQTALAQELNLIEALPISTNIRKPNNPFWQSLFRIAGIAKTGYISREEALLKIQAAAKHLNERDKDVAYQWNRAYQRAPARYPTFS
ncbi:MAG: hypothetical protein H6658_11490 [Ardenticatenaceae bacterium]|nr:hypothetical protein [Ardenticatenaceae bacterium]